MNSVYNLHFTLEEGHLAVRSCSWNEIPFRWLLFNFCMVAWSVWLPVNPKPWLALNEHFTAAVECFSTNIWRFGEMPVALPALPSAQALCESSLKRDGQKRLTWFNLCLVSGLEGGVSTGTYCRTVKNYPFFRRIYVLQHFDHDIWYFFSKCIYFLWS